VKCYKLFEDQEEFVDQIRASLRAGHRAILGVASPAFGKTVVAGHIISEARKKSDSTAWFLVHRKNLLRQTSKSFWAAHIEHGLITSGRRASTLPIQVGTIGSVYSRLGSLKPPSIMFVDEAHLARGNMFSSVIEWARESGTIVIGLTGTPIRLDGKALGDLFSDMVEARSTSWLIDQGRLSSYDMYSTPQGPDLSEVKNSGGDYNKSQLADAMDSRAIVGDAVIHWRKYAAGMRTVIYCVNVKHSKHTAELFNEAGISAVHVDADTTEAELKDACEGLADGKYKVICNCELVIEGFDLSAQIGRDITIECVVLLRPTQSLARYLQMIFRSLRRKPQAAIILDHAGCAMQHGLPDDDREWTLDGAKKGKRKVGDDEADVKITQCKTCHHIFRPTLTSCPRCGLEVPAAEVREIKVVEGELEKIDVAMIRKQQKQEQAGARDLRDLVALGKRRGMKNAAAWAAHVHASRSGRKATAQDFHQAKQVSV